MKIVLSRHGRTFASRTRARELLGAQTGGAARASVTIDASGVYMSPSFIAELLVGLVKERGCKRIVIQGAREHPARVARHLADKFGYGDRVEVEQPAAATS